MGPGMTVPNKDFWTRTLLPKDQQVPGWTGFHAVLNYNIPGNRVKTTVAYNPIVPGIPASMDTMYTGWKKIEAQMLSLGQESPVITLDLQLYIIAQQVRFHNWDELKHHMLRMGGFHIMELYWKILGKQYADSCLDDILVEADVFGSNSASLIMQGKHYTHCTLTHKHMFECMCHLQWQSFLTWLIEKNKIQSQEIDHIELQCRTLQHIMKLWLQTNYRIKQPWKLSVVQLETERQPWKNMRMIMKNSWVKERNKPVLSISGISIFLMYKWHLITS